MWLFRVECGRGVWAYGDEERSELVVGGVGVGSGGASAWFDDAVDGFGGVRCWLGLCRSRRRVRPSTCARPGPGKRFRGWDTLVGSRQDERPGVVLGQVWLDGRHRALAGCSGRQVRH